MAPALGRPFVEWVARFLVKQGIRRIIFSTGYKGDLIAAHFAECSWPGVELSCVAELEPLGTAGGFLQAAGSVDSAPEGWLVLNGDSLTMASLQPMLERIDHCDGVLMGCEMQDAARFGTLSCGPEGRLLAFAEKRPGAGLINSGVYLFRNSLLTRFPAQRPLSFETDIFPVLLAAKVDLQVVPVSAPFLDIGTPETLPEVERFISRHAREFASD